MKLIIIVFCIIAVKVSAQSFGFGCLGLVGGFGGYSFQEIDATGLNSIVTNLNSRQDSIINSMPSFNSASGYKVGINFFRADFSGFILTAKGFYQSLTQKKSADYFNTTKENHTFDLKIKSWALGIDLGTTITKSFSWKVIDATLLYGNAVYTNTIQTQTRTNSVQFSSPSSLGYTVGTGFIYSIIDDYVSIEGLIGYTVFAFKDLEDEEGNDLLIPGGLNFISNGGLKAEVQLNLGFPL